MQNVECRMQKEDCRWAGMGGVNSLLTSDF